jgi:anti-anti-sigma regulatory factor
MKTGIERLTENVFFVCLQEPQLKYELVAVNDVVSEGCSCDVIIDFSNVRLLTSGGISSLIILERLLDNFGHKVILCSVSDKVKQVLGRAGVQSLFEFADDESAALQSIQSRSK